MVVVKRFISNTLCFILLFCFTSLTSATVTPTFINPTPANNTVTSNTSILINISFTEPYLTNVTYIWNGTNYTLYDNSTLLFLMGFNNFSGIGDNTTTAVDVSARARNGTITGAIFNTTGRYGGAYSFMAGNQYIQTQRNFMNNLSTFSMAGWVYAEATGNRIAFFGQNDAIEFGFIDANTITFYTSDASSASWTINSTLFPLNAWNFVAVTANNNTNPSLTIYINGIAQATGGTVTDTFGNSVYNFSIGGCVWDPTGNNFTGMIDEVMVFNRTLTPAEVYLTYSSNLYKYANDQWYLSINQSLNATQTLVNGTYTYQVFTQNISGTSLNTEQRTVIIGQLPGVPEFGEWAILLILISTVLGYFQMKKANLS
ncbi:LamG domain-containing protein [Candidatus Woesearchaeota archaeon]|nr:LamG domain-containing protein [Candidatus Woesearchaeota archaeon]